MVGFVISTLYKWNYIQHTEHLPGEFGLPEYSIDLDVNKNHVNDAKDILQGALNYVAMHPEHEELHEYPGDGWPSGKKGSAGDVVAYAFKEAGFDLRTLINQDITKNPDAYDSKNPLAENIAFRVVENQRVYFSRYAESLDTDYTKTKEWQQGDVVFFEKNHVAVVADKVNEKGIRFIVHNFWKYQAGYFQDVLETNAWGKVVGHYRVARKMLTPKTDNKTVTTTVAE